MAQQDKLDSHIDEILELLHNSWLEDDYDPSDPEAAEARHCVKRLIDAELTAERNRLLDRLDAEIDRIEKDTYLDDFHSDVGELSNFIDAERNKS